MEAKPKLKVRYISPRLKVRYISPRLKARYISPRLKARYTGQGSNQLAVDLNSIKKHILIEEFVMIVEEDGSLVHW